MMSQKKKKVDAIKNNRLIPKYLQTCSSTFCVYIVGKYLYFYFISAYFSQKNDNKLRNQGFHNGFAKFPVKMLKNPFF